MKKKKRATRKAVQPVSVETFVFPATGTITASTNPNAGDIIWYDAPEKQSIFHGLISRLKSLFLGK